MWNFTGALEYPFNLHGQNLAKINVSFWKKVYIKKIYCIG